MTLRRRANEIPELIRRLGDSRPVCVDAAKARLSVIGARAVEALIEALDGDGDPARIHAVQLLALIQDPRGREPLKALLFDAAPGVCAQAARALARFPTADSVAAVERLLRRASEPDVRIAALEALIEVYVGGQESALAPVLTVLLDPSENTDLRQAATALLPRLPGTERRTLRRRLDKDPVPEIAKAEPVAHGVVSEDGEPATGRLLADLASDDYGTWDRAVHRLTARGATVVEPLVDEMCRRSQDPEYGMRSGMVLRAMGPRRGRKVADLLERVREPLPLSILVEVIGSYRVHAMTYRLADVIEALAERRAKPVSDGSADLLERVRAKAHLELAKIGSRVAIQDLREALGNGRRRIEMEMVAAVELVGKRDELLDLLRAWRHEDTFMRNRIADAVRTVMRRERIRRNSVALRSLGEDHRATILEMLDDRTSKRTSHGRRGPRPAR